MKKLIIIAGASGEIGSAFIKKILVHDHVECIAIIRNKPLLLEHRNLRKVVCNLDNAYEIKNSFKDVDFSMYEEVTYLHTIGVDKFDPRNYPHITAMKTIDPDVYNTNVNTFKYLFRYCIEEIRKINNSSVRTLFKSMIIAGASDKYTPFVIESFCEAKFILRQYIQSAVGLYPTWCSGLSINITSTITESALAVRPFADTTFWLTPTEVADQSINKVLSNEKGYNEIDIIKYSPEYESDYYTNNEKLYMKWSKETGIS
jgi:hypothetical protein